jgi:type IV secretion system protein VirB10
MTERIDPGTAETVGADHNINSNSPLPGEPGIPNVAARPRGSMSKKGLIAVGLLILSLVAVSAL